MRTTKKRKSLRKCPSVIPMCGEFPYAYYECSLKFDHIGHCLHKGYIDNNTPFTLKWTTKEEK